MLGTMSNRALFMFVLWMLSMIHQGVQYATTTAEGPCIEELNRSQSEDESAFKPRCTIHGFYESKQCNTKGCGCLDRCGRGVTGTSRHGDMILFGDESISCEELPEQPQPCLEEYMAGLSSNPVVGQFRPRCRSDGFYYHTQCTATSCYCSDKCGFPVLGSLHPISQVGEAICACPNDDHAYRCHNPCEGAFCELHPDATCKPSMCGGCKAEFYLDGNLVKCVAESCTDYDGTQYPIDSDFERDCRECHCHPWGEIRCHDKSCPSLPRPPWGCEYVTLPGGCCPERLSCQQPLYECQLQNLPVALCRDNPCKTAQCEAYPDAVCIVQFCGSRACTAAFYDKGVSPYDDDKKEVDCSANDGGKRAPGELQGRTTVIPTTPPTSSPCPTITCANVCSSSGRKVINGCRTCECVDTPTTIPSCPPVTCSHFCGPSGLKIVNGCEICECAEKVVSTTTPPTTTSPPPTTIPSSPCPLITCKNSCPLGRKVIGGCRTCECIKENSSSTAKPTLVPSECMDAEGQFHVDGSRWTLDPCTTCICENGEVTCFHKYCAVPPPYCKVDLVQDPEACCPSFTCPQSCTDSFGNERSFNEVYFEGCQTCTCTPYGKPICTPIPCPAQATNPPAGCQYVKPPAGCCPTRLACIESESDCVGPVALCFHNPCLDEVCEAYPDARCSISFCGVKACQAVFYDENNQELDCKIADIKEGDCFDESSGKTYKVGDVFTNECNDCTCMQNDVIVCTEKPCGCVEESSGTLYKIGDSYYDGCNQCLCKEGGFMCSMKECKNEEN